MPSPILLNQGGAKRMLTLKLCFKSYHCAAAGTNGPNFPYFLSLFLAERGREGGGDGGDGHIAKKGKYCAQYAPALPRRLRHTGRQTERTGERQRRFMACYASLPALNLSD